MNRRNQGQGQSRRLSQSSQPIKGSRFNSQNFDDQNYEGKSLRANEKGNYSGMMNASHWDDDSDTGYMGSSDYRDTDYDLDGSTYGSHRSSREMNSYGDYETNDRNRQPSRHSSLDDDRLSSRSRSFDRSFSNERDFSNRGVERQGSSSERFGYPSTMNSWAHSDRSTSGYDRDMNRGQARSTWGTSDRAYGSSERPWSTGERFSSDRDLSRSQSYGQSYGEGSLERDSESQFGSSQASGFFGKGPKGYRRSDDRIKEEVCETLSRHPRIDASDIEVKVEEACVTLSGTVESKEIKRAAEMAIENLSGVDDVKNELRVKRADDSIFASSAGGKNATSSTTGTTGSKSTSTSSSKGSSHL